MVRLLTVITACLIVETRREACADPIPGTKQPAAVDFQREVQPLLAERCYRCHGPDAAHRKADLRLDTLEGATQDLGDRRAIVARKPRESELLTRVTTDDSTLRMPPPEAGEPLSPREVELLTRWIEQGAEYSRHWLHAPLVRPAVPMVKSGHGTGNAIDAFVVEKLEAEGIPQAAEADQRTLVRRLSQDLLALPATATQLTELETTSNDTSWELLVNRQLANPAFGERMAMYWLDLVRYADTVGYHGDQEHHISPYRDYVISAFNQNLPFDRFTREQLAGDLLPDPTLDQRVATGYIRVLQTSHEGGVQRAEYQKKYDADRVRNLGSVWLGMTVACAECHDHKYDPIRQRDFYSLAAFFADVDDVRSFSGGDSNPTRREPEIEILSDEDRSLIEQWKQEIAELTAKGTTDETRATIKAKQSAINAARARGRRCMIVERNDPREIRVLARGNWMDESGPIVAPAPPIALGEFSVGDRRATRLDLSNWLTTEARGQTARVFVNRLWSLFFGYGLSRTLDDFGVQGDRPSHPELLEWLASEFVDSGWDVKHVVRLIVTSRTYRAISQESPTARERDPDNRWLSHQGRWRLSAEAVRDQALAVSGLLVARMGGKSVRPWQAEGYYVQLNFPRREYQPDRNADQYRRGVYTHWQRQYLHPMLKAFDAPMREECVARRNVSNTPQAALALLNDPSFIECAKSFAIQILREPVTSDHDRLRFAWRELLARDPSSLEMSTLEEFLSAARDEFADESAASQLLSAGLVPTPTDISVRELAAWTSVTRLLFNLSESLIRD